ncbi:MAG: hypothetical protein IIC88_01170 [Chloroflexi bacterium]|nr:hypothetical protein [Chloroflexota bacterium]
MRRSRVLAGIIPLAICIPCLIPVLLAAGIGAGAFSAFGAWFTDNSFVLAAGTIVAVAFVAAAGFIYVRRENAAACEVDEAGSGSLTPKARLSESDR